MVINKASKCRIYPTKEQLNKINKTLGSCRYIYNKMLERQNKMYKRRKDHLTYNEMQNLLPIMKEYLPWLKEADSQALKYACRQVDSSYQKFFKHETGYPKFHSKKGTQSYTSTKASTIHISEDRRTVKLPCLGWVKVRGLNIPNEAVITRATVSLDPDGKYYVSIAYKQEIHITGKVIDTNNSIGIDFRERDLFVDSDNNSAGKPNNVMESINRLKCAQDKLSRMIESHIVNHKTIGNKRYPVYDKPLSECKNIQKQRKRIARIHKHISNQRKDFLHKQSAAIAKQYDVICIEALKMKDMLMSKNEDPSAIKRCNVNRKIYDNGWYMFTQMLAYKASWMGKHLIKVAEDYPSSEICSCCEYVELRLKDISVRKWICPACGTPHDRDHNAAINIRAEGLRILKTS